ncbi:L-glutamate gamma-semialdehyde dehydrogenase, partial [Polaribacter sp.]
MARGFFNVPKAVNEPVKEYAPGSPEREEVLATYKEMFHSNIDVPMHINGEEVRTGNTKNITPPHDHQHVVGQYHTADKSHVDAAISTALAAREAWSNVSWTERATIFLKAAELLAGPYRAKMNAATMIAQSKNVYQAEIDAACEMIDFFRFNVQYMTDIFKDQPASAPGIWNRVEYRPLEGFVYAISPFNFTSIAANLPAAAALMGNVVVWKPSDHQAYSAQVIVDLFKEAGLPDGVINVIYGDPVMISDTVLASPDFSGLHFTGSTHVFKNLWKQIGNNIHTYKTYPRIVGETGGKDFVWVHNSSNSLQVATAITRGAFEYQGQKCSAASRAYIPASMWEDVKEHLITQAKEIKMGSPEDPSNFVNAVIHEGSFDKIAHFIDAAKADKDADVIIGGGHDKSVGYFIEPTVIVAKSPTYATMTTELFGPVMTIFVYEDAEWEASLKLVDESTEFALTGAIFST